MKIYYSSALGRQDKLNRNNIKNILISVFGIKDLEKEIQKNSWMLSKNVSLMIDNGAFSSWNSNKKIISIEEYTKFCLKFHKKFSSTFKNIYYIGLDDIPGDRNSIPSKYEIDTSCEITFNNYKYMLDNGCVNVLPVVHQLEDISWLKKYEEYTDFICIGGIKRNKSNWFDEAFSCIKNTTKLHGLAVTSKSMNEKYPWFSVDSTSWVAPFAFGRVFDWSFYKLNTIKSVLGMNDNMSLREFEIKLSLFNNNLSKEQKSDEQLDYHINALQKLEKYITQLWTKRGVTWDE